MTDNNYYFCLYVENHTLQSESSHRITDSSWYFLIFCLFVCQDKIIYNKGIECDIFMYMQNSKQLSTLNKPT